MTSGATCRVYRVEKTKTPRGMGSPQHVSALTGDLNLFPSDATLGGSPASCQEQYRNRKPDGRVAYRERDLKAVWDVRGLGLMVGVELVSDRATKAGFDPAKKVINRVRAELETRGVFTRNMRDILAFSPALVITEAQVDRLVESTRGAIAAVLPERA